MARYQPRKEEKEKKASTNKATSSKYSVLLKDHILILDVCYCVRENETYTHTGILLSAHAYMNRWQEDCCTHWLEELPL